MDKNKKIVIALVSILVVVMAIVSILFLLNNDNKTPNSQNNNPNQNGENNNSNNGNSGNSGENNTENNENESTGNVNNGNSGNQSGGNTNTGNSGNNSGNTNTGNSGSGTTVVKKLRNFSCRKTTTLSGVKAVESVKLQYHIEKGIKTDETILTISLVDESGKKIISSYVEIYQSMWDKFKKNKGFTATSTTSNNKYIFSVKTNYEKVDFSKVSYKDDNGLHLYHPLRKNDSLEVINRYFKIAGYTCQVSEG